MALDIRLSRYTPRIGNYKSRRTYSATAVEPNNAHFSPSQSKPFSPWHCEEVFSLRDRPLGSPAPAPAATDTSQGTVLHWRNETTNSFPNRPVQGARSDSIAVASEPSERSVSALSATSPVALVRTTSNQDASPTSHIWRASHTDDREHGRRRTITDATEARIFRYYTLYAGHWVRQH